MASIPYGLRDVKVATIDPITGAKGTMVDLPNSQTLDFSESEEFTELRGDDKVVAKRGSGPTIEWSLESGGISLPALVVINGGTLTTSGTGPTVKNTYKKKATDARPYFWAEGQAMSDSGGDFHVILEKCKADGSVEGTLADGEFWITKCDGSGIATNLDDLYSFVENVTTAAIAQPT
jgi:hypothetical protein